MPKFEIVHYERSGKDIFQDWLDNLRDVRAKTTIARVIKRLESGNFGVHRFCRNGIWELKIDYGAGYRVYYSIVGQTIILLLCAGDKSSQQKDIAKAVEYLQKFREENEQNGHH